MIYQATRAIARAFDRNGWRYKIDESNGKSVLNTTFNADNVESVRILYISRDNDNDVSVRVFEYVKGNAGRMDALLEVVNRMNNKYRFFKFVLDDDNDINIEYDFPEKCDDVGETAVEIANRIVDIAGEAYPEFMRALWS